MSPPQSAGPRVFQAILWTALLCCLGSNAAHADTPVCGSITTNTTWNLAGSPYIATCTVTIQNNATLTIDPGVVVKFNAMNGLLIGTNSNGVLLAQGTLSQPITFTANSATPTPGFWGPILFGGYTSGANRMEYCVIEYGGSGGSDANIQVANAPGSITIQNSTIRYSDGYGVWTIDSTLTIVNNTITNNATYGVYLGAGYVHPIIQGNTFANNGLYPLHLEITSYPAILAGNTYTNNGIQAIELVGWCGPGTLSASLALVNEGIPYVVASDICVYSSPAAPVTLTLPPGTTLKFNPGVRLRVGGGVYYPGNLIAQGTPSQPITFTANSPTPTPGFWWGLEAYTSQTVLLDYCVIEYGGSGGTDANLYIGNPAPVISTMQHSTIQASDGYGVVVEAGSALTLTHSNVIGNVLGGLNSSPLILARLNWWGDASGPSGIGSGSGAAILGAAAFEPWLGAPFTTPLEWFNAQESADPFSQVGGSTTLSGMLTESANWTVTVRDSASAIVKTFTGTGTSLAQGWAGDDASGTPLPNGTYTYQLDATSVNTGQAAAPAIGTLTLNNTLPFATITPPIPNQMIPSNASISVMGTAAGPGFSFYTLEYGTGVLPTSWTTIAFQTTPVTNGQLGLWQTAGLTKPVYTLRLRVTAGSTTVTETISVRLLDLANLSDAPDPFSPNGDGIDETTTISVIATHPITWTLTIKDSASATVKMYTGSGQTISQVWDGTNQSGVLAPDGLYTYQFQGTDTASGVSVLSSVGQVALQHISVTNVSVSPSVIDPFLGQQTSITYTLVHSLNLPMMVVVNLYNEKTRQLTRTLTIPGQLPGPNNVVWDGKDGGGVVAPLEAYYFTIDATDAVGATDRYNDPVSPIPNSTTPNATQTTPSLSSFNPYQNDVVQIGYSLDAAARMTVRITNIPSNTTTIHTLVNGAVRLSGSHLEVWDGRLANGTFYQGPFNAFVDVPVGLAENAIVLSHPLADITNFRAEAYLIQPVHREISTLSYTLTQAAAVTITITDPNGSHARTLQTNVPQLAGPYSLEWDGRDDQGRVVAAEGVYTVTLTGVDSVSGLSSTRLGTITVYK